MARLLIVAEGADSFDVDIASDEEYEVHRLAEQGNRQAVTE